jgi:pyridine nucleotide-disulfide oxidoreductase family protein
VKKRLVLVGGGHSHALVLKYWGQTPLSTVDLTLVSDVKETPYSGMLPGHVAGFYSHRESHIDLLPLVRGAGAQFIHARAIAIDPVRKVLLTEPQGEIEFDYLSLDIGSTPYLGDIEGADYGIAAKPVAQFLQQWQALLDQIQTASPQPLTLAIAGGGAGGVELAFNVQARLQRQFPNLSLTLQLWQRGLKLLPSHSDWARRKVMALLTERQIQVFLNQTVTAIAPDPNPEDFPRYQLHTAMGEVQAVNAVFLLTQASAPDWLHQSGLRTDDRGFVLVDQTLRSLSHPHIFAAGDVASLSPHPCPKAGVFAVRQGRPLFKNLQRVLAGRSPSPIQLPTRYLSVIGTGDQRALALWGQGGCYGRSAWWLKDWIDRRFMKRLGEQSLFYSRS